MSEKKAGPSGDVIRAYLTRWKPQAALGHGWKLLDAQLRRAVVLPVALVTVPVLVLVSIALVDHAWVQAPSGPIRWNPDFTDPLRLATLAAALIVSQLAIAQIGRALLRRVRSGAENAVKATAGVGRSVLPAVLLGSVPKVVAGVLAVVIIQSLPPQSPRADLAFALAVLPLMYAESRFAFWHLALHDPMVPTRSAAVIAMRTLQLTSLCWGRILVIQAMLGAGLLIVLWLLALLAANQPEMALLWLSLGVFPAAFCWLWFAATVSWIHETESKGPAGTARKPGGATATTAPAAKSNRK